MTVRVELVLSGTAVAACSSRDDCRIFEAGFQLTNRAGQPCDFIWEKSRDVGTDSPGTAHTTLAEFTNKAGVQLGASPTASIYRPHGW